MNAELPSTRDSQPKSPEWYARQNSGERIRLIERLVIAPLILLIGFLPLGKTIPWGVR